MNDRSSRDYSSDRGSHQGGRGNQHRGNSGQGNGDRAQRRSYNDRDDRGQRSGERSERPRKQFNDRGEGGERRSYGDRNQRGGDDRRNPRDNGERRSYSDRNDRGGDRRSYNDRNDRGGERRSYGDRDGGQRRSYGDRDDRGQRSGDRSERPRKQFNDRGEGGERRSYNDRNQRGGDDRRNNSRDNGERRSYSDRNDRGGERRSYNDRDGGQRRSYGDRDNRGQQRGSDRGERRAYGDRDNGRSQQRDGQGSYGRGGTRGAGRSDRGGAGRQFTEAERLQHELRPVRAEHKDPWIPEEIEPKDLYPAARNELKTLQAEVQERVARHLATALMLLDEDPELAHEHALSASRRAGRIPVAREFLAMTAYRTGDFALALRELRTYRRLSGRDNHVALMVECERGLARPEKAVETGLEVDASKLETEQRVHLAIAMSGARLDLGQAQQALFELEIPELNPDRGFSWSPELFAAYAAVLEELGRSSEAATWAAHADRAERALEQHFGGDDEIDVYEVIEHDFAADSGGEADNGSALQDEVAAAERAEVADTGAEADAAVVAEDSVPTVAEASTATNEQASASALEQAPAPASFEDEIAAEVDELLAEAGIVGDVAGDATDDSEAADEASR